MFRHRLWRAPLLAGISWLIGADIAAAQLFSAPPEGDKFGGLTSLSSLQNATLDSAIFKYNSPGTSVLQSSLLVSKLDLKAPGNARKEYDKGFQLLMRKDSRGAIEHLSRAVAVYPSYVAAHNALGIAYLNSGQLPQAKEEFAQAVALDEYLPKSHLNLGCAQLQLQNYSEAVGSLKKASSIAPLDLDLQTALAYAQFKNRDYSAVIATAHSVHKQKHKNATLVHLFAAGAWHAQQNLDRARDEMETLLNEDPDSPFAGQLRQFLLQLQAEQVNLAQFKRRPADPPGSASPQIQQDSPSATEQNQSVAARTETDATCIGCLTNASGDPAGSTD